MKESEWEVLCTDSTALPESHEYLIPVLVNSVEYKEHKKQRVSIAKFHKMFAFYFLKITSLIWSPWHTIYSCIREGRLTTTAQTHTTCLRRCSTLAF
jgi:hypothetical protein